MVRTDGESVRHTLDLAPYRNNVGCTLPGVEEPSGLDGFGRTLPAEEVAVLAPLMGGLPTGWGRGEPDNVSCEGQVITLPAVPPLTGWSVIGACDGGSVCDTFVLVDSAGRQTSVPVGLTDFVGGRAAFTDVVEVVCTHLRERGQDIPSAQPRLWRASHRFGEPVAAERIILPLNPGIHVFAVLLDEQPS